MRKQLQHISRRALAVCFGFSIGVTTPSSYAFKIDTHVYIAQQVINDLTDDGAVTLTIGGQTYTYPIDPDVVHAITTNPAYFRMGSIGPDAFPDIVSGQNVIHPGHDTYTEWGTAEWMRHLASAATSDQEIAFARGVYVHAASDVFAHSYINHYSGNVWLLTDETFVERRHFILESFVASKNPPILDDAGNNLGSAASTLLTTSGELAIPAEFLARALIFDGTAARHFEEGAPHLSFLYHHEDNLAHLEQQARDIAIEIERLVLWYKTGIQLNRGELAKLRKELNDIRRTVVPVDKIQDASNRIADIRKKFVKIPADVIEDHLQKLVELYGKFGAERKKFEDAGQNLARLSDELNKKISACRATKHLNDAHCTWTKNLGPLGGLITKTDPVCIAREKKVYQQALKICESIQAVTELSPKIAEARKQRDNLERSTLGLKDDLIKVTNEIESIMVTQIDLEHQLFYDALELVKLSQIDIDGVVSFIGGWRAGVKEAGKALAVANGTAMINSIRGQDVLDPLSEWLKCYTPVVAGIPYPVVDAACTVGDARDKVLASLTKIATTLAKYDPVTKAVIYQALKLKEAVNDLIENATVEVLQVVTGQPVKQLLSIIREPGTTEAVTHIFSTGQEYGLRAIPDAAYRVGAEMHLTDGHFDPKKYPVVYDAIVLSKLSLLNATQLNKLAMDAGIGGPTSYGATLFEAGAAKGANVLNGSIRSIDGSDQWMERAMPFLRTWGHEHPELGRYTYLRDWDPANGFRLWTDLDARKQIFRRIFIGPLVAGIDAPSTIGFPPILLATYPYKVCAANPFPDENKRDTPDTPVDTTCLALNTTTQLDANPDATEENIDQLKQIHAQLAEITIASFVLTNPAQWNCVSEDPEEEQTLNFWTFKFRTDGHFVGTVSQGKRGMPAARQQLSAINGTYTITGDFLFTSPKGAAVAQTGGNVAAIPTLVRRYTQHPQRYWIEPQNDASTLHLQNQDGTTLYCGTRQPELTTR